MVIGLLVKLFLIIPLLQASDINFTDVQFALIIDVEDNAVLNTVKTTVEEINENEYLLHNLSLSYSVFITKVC